MRTGTIDGFVHGQWSIAHDSGEIGTAVTTYDITGLNGDSDQNYMLIARCINGYSGGAGITFQFNADSTTYGYQRMTGVTTTAAALAGTSESNIDLCSFTALGDASFSRANIDAVSGVERVVKIFSNRKANGASVTEVRQETAVWDNTASNINTINITGDQTDAIGVGSRFILLKLGNASNSMKSGDLDVDGTLSGCWERIATASPTSGTSVSLTSLTGNTDHIYKVVMKFIAGDSPLGRRFNSDTGANYGYQSLRGIGAVPAASNASHTQNVFGWTGATSSGSGEAWLIEDLVYVNAGYERTSLTRFMGKCATTAVNDAIMLAHTWSNTADEITSMQLTAGLFGSGTEIELYRLNL